MRRRVGIAPTHALPLLFKGEDFVHTDIAFAYTPVP
ncbi:type II toxin-antitoxin system VapC family toxin [Methylobacterium sp. CM6241]|nr:MULTISPECIES: type II toxin-antitoxin system VapC family toxin [unclassified Methylobacterium]